MSKFTDKLGRPEPALPPGLAFPKRGDRSSWESLYEDTGAGWYRDGFYLLFAEGVARLERCLRSWSFLVKAHPKRVILGRNAYGAILVYEEAPRPGAAPEVFILDPLTVQYWTSPNVILQNLILNYLPNGTLPAEFSDSSVYDRWRERTGERLGDDEILAVKEPLSLGGTFTAENFQREDIFAFYASTGAVYRKAFRGKSKTER